MVEELSRRHILKLLTGGVGAIATGLSGLSLSEQTDYRNQALQENKPDLVPYPHPEKLIANSGTWRREAVDQKTNVWNTEKNQQWYYGTHPSQFATNETRSQPPFEVGVGKEAIVISRDSLQKLGPQIPKDIHSSNEAVIEYFASADQQAKLDEAFRSLQLKNEDAALEISMTFDTDTWFTISSSVQTVVAVATDPLGDLVAEWRKSGDKIIPVISRMENYSKVGSGLLLASALGGGVTIVDTAQAAQRQDSETKVGISRRFFLAAMTAMFLGAGNVTKFQAQQAGQEAAAGFNIESFLSLKLNDVDDPMSQLDVFWTKFSADLGEPPLYAAVLLRDLVSIYMEKSLNQQGIDIDTQVWGSEHEHQVGLKLLPEEELLTMIKTLFTKYGNFFRNYLSLNDFASSTNYFYKRNESGNLIMNEIKFYAFPQLIAIFNSIVG